jgi:hypothetical protein
MNNSYETDTIQKVIDSLNKLIFNLKFGTLEIDKIPLIIHGLTIAKDYLENDGHKFEKAVKSYDIEVEENHKKAKEIIKNLKK